MVKKRKTAGGNAIAILKNDHKTVKELFDKFEDAENPSTQAKIAAEALNELKIHAKVEEELFYPTIREEIKDEEGIMEEADEEHHVAKILIAELEQMTGDEEHWEAKFKVLAENVRHHIKEEEGQMFPKAKETAIDFVALGEQMNQLKEQLMQQGVPPDAEAKMIAKVGLRGDSPARQAQAKLQASAKQKAS